MKQQICTPTGLPTAHVCIKKSRLKVYHKETSPTYYLTNGTEFSIELFNPTSDVILAKIILNSKTISQGGLVLNPGQRVHLERYLDIDRAFKFSTYEVANTEEVKKAIEDNGDIKVEFFKESVPYFSSYGYNNYTYPINPNPWPGNYVNCYHSGTGIGYVGFSTLTTANGMCGTVTNTSAGGTFSQASGSLANSNSATFTTSSFNSGNANTCADGLSDEFKSTLKRSASSKKSKTIETGRVEMGSESDQRFKTVSKDFDYWAFHTVEYKMLPISQKVNTLEDINVKRYCTSCGAKVGKTDKFCSSCGTRA